MTAVYLVIFFMLLAGGVYYFISTKNKEGKTTKVEEVVAPVVVPSKPLTEAELIALDPRWDLRRAVKPAAPAVTETPKATETYDSPTVGVNKETGALEFK